MALDSVVGELAVLIVPDSTGFGAKADASLTAQSGGIGGKAGAAIGLGLAGAAAGTFAKSVKDFAGFEQGLNEVFTLIPDAGQKTFDSLTEQTKSFAKEFGVLPQEVIKPLYDSISAGVPPDNVFSFLETANKFAKAGAVDLGTSVDALTTGVNAFGLTADDAGRVSDSLFTAVKGGKTTVDELAASLFQVAPVAGSFGIQVEEVSAALATLTASGTPTAAASTQIKGAIAELGKEGTKANTAFQELTGQGFQQFIDGGGTFQEAANIIAKGAEDSGISVLDMFGSIEAGQAVLGLTGDKAAIFAKNLDAQAASAGATQVAFEQMQKGITPALDKIKARLAVAFLELGTTIAPAIEKVGLFLADFIGIIADLPGPLSAVVVGAVGFGGALLALSGPILKATQVIGGIGKAVTGLTKLLAANPYILLIAATIALAYIVYKNWDSIKAFIGDAVDAIGGVVSTVTDAIAKPFVAAYDAVAGALNSVIDFIQKWVDRIKIIFNIFTKGDFIGQGLSGWGEDSPIIGTLFDLRDKVIEILDSIKGAFATLASPFIAAYDAVTGALNSISDFAEKWIERIKIIFNILFKGDFIGQGISGWAEDSGIVDTLFNIREKFLAFVDSIVGFFTDLKDGIVGAMTAVKDFVVSIWDAIIGAITTAVHAIEAVVSAVFNAIQAVIETVLDAIKTIIDFYWNLYTTIFTTALDIIRTVVSTVFDAIRTVIDTVMGFISTVIDNNIRFWTNIFTTGLDLIKSVVSTVFDAIKVVIDVIMGYISTVIDNNIRFWGGIFTTGLNAIKAVVDLVWNGIQVVIQTVMGVITGVIQFGIGIWTMVIQTGLSIIQAVVTTVWNTLKAITELAWNGIQAVISSVVGVVSGVVNTWIGVFGAIGGVMSSLLGTVQSVWGGIRSAIEGAVNAAITAIGRLNSAVSGALGGIGNLIGKAGKVGSVFGKIPGFDLGGVVPGPIGSPQLILAHGGETVLPTHKYPISDARGSAGQGGGAPGTTVQVVLAGDMVIRDDRDVTMLGRDLGRAAARELQAQGAA